MSMKWYIIHTTPGLENKVRDRLLSRIKESDMQAKFGEILVPTEETAELRNGAKKIVQRRIYSGYVFLNMEFDDNAWHLVRKTPNVTGFLGGAQRPSAMPQAEIDQIMNRVNQTAVKPVHKIIFKDNEIVRIIDGPFKDFNGAVSQVDYDKAKLKVLVSVFGRETPLEIGFGDVEKVG